MRISNNTVLITGGATGIGFALAEKFTSLGNKVVICGRRENKLSEAKAKLPGIEAIRCNIANSGDREMLYDRISAEFPETNLLVNNAGIQRRIDFTKGMEDLLNNEDEIDINLKAQVHLSALFVPFLMKKESAAIINVSSGLGFVPLSMFPVYSATKAALHSFSISLRHQLRNTRVKVFEIVPPTVHDTELKGNPIEKADWSLSAKEVADATLNGIESDSYEIGIGASSAWLSASKDERDKIFSSINH